MRRRQRPTQPLPPHPPNPNWSRSGGPVAAPKSAGRSVTTATGTAVRIVAAEGAQPAAAGEAATGEPGEGAKPGRHRHGRRDRSADFRKLRPDAPAEGAAAPAAEGAPAREPRDDKGRPSRPRFEGKGEDRNKGKFGGGRDKGGRDKGGRDRDKGGRESGPSHRQYATSAGPRERDRPVDPNSPFAKLAALREQLTANRKD